MKSPESLLPSSHSLCHEPSKCIVEALDQSSFDEERYDESAEQITEAVYAASSAWSQISKNVFIFVNDTRSEFQSFTQQGPSRSDRRANGQGQESFMGQSVARAHNAAMAVYQTGVLEEMYQPSLINGEPMSIEQLALIEEKIISEQSTRMNNLGFDRSTIVKDELATVFQLEYLARAYMQVLNHEMPELLQELFDPATLKELPISVQRIAALDIKRGIGESVLLDNASKYAPGNQPESMQFAEYIRANTLPEQVKKTLLAIKLGMNAMGAPICPFNDIGICTHLLTKIPRHELPEDLIRDIVHKEDTAAAKRVEDLTLFARRTAVSKILDSSIPLFEQDASAQTPSRKRVTAAKLDKRDFTAIEPTESDAPNFTAVKIRFAHSDEVVDSSLADFEAIGEMVMNALDQKDIKKYLDTYNDKKLEGLISNALTSLALLPNYTASGRMITPWVGMKNKPHVNDEGVKERYMRFSGARAVGISPGPIGKATRIIFSQGTADGVRHITIHKIIHKADVKQRMTF